MKYRKYKEGIKLLGSPQTKFANLNPLELVSVAGSLLCLANVPNDISQSGNISSDGSLVDFSTGFL